MTNDTIAKTYIPERFAVHEDGNVLTFAVTADELVAVCTDLYRTHGLPLKTITATDDGHGAYRVWYVFGVPHANVFIVPCLTVTNTEVFPSLLPGIHEAAGYERKIRSFFGLQPVGHPHPRPILLHENWPAEVFPLRKDFDGHQRPPEAHGEYQFQKVDGEGIYEIPVGPVHAGIIEPGHFRFSVAGEEIMLLEAKLGFKHKGIEKLFEQLPLDDQVRLAERVSGDTSFTHSLAFCQAVESLANIAVPERGQALRVIFSELERIANHLNDVGFIMLDTGYSFGGSHGARLREIIMQWHERLTGSRFLRGVNVIGGVTTDITPAVAGELAAALKKLLVDFEEVIAISETSSSLLNRLQDTGKLDPQIARDHGVVGIPARALGFATDARRDYPYAIYPQLSFNVATEPDGDVRSRLYVRIKEIHTSVAIITQVLASMPAGEAIRSPQEVVLVPNSCRVGMAEGWRGDIVYFVVTDADGAITRVDVRDPSFLNWSAVGHAGKGNVVPDFPLINKSFNLSYSGNDL